MILDTSFIIDLLRGKNQRSKAKAEELDNEFRIKAVCSVTVMELWRGAVRSLRSEEEKRKVNELLKSLLVYPFNEKDAKKAGEIEAELIKKGKIIDLEDIMIAGMARARKQKILTRNVEHFERISGIEIEMY